LVDTVHSGREGRKTIILSHGSQIVRSYHKWTFTLRVRRGSDVRSTHRILIYKHVDLVISCVLCCGHELSIKTLEEHVANNGHLRLVFWSQQLNVDGAPVLATILNILGKSRKWYSDKVRRITARVDIRANIKVKLEVVVPYP